MQKCRAAISWSGGKDSCLAFYRASQHLEIGALVTMFTEDGSRSRSHGLRPEILRRQADLLGLELICGCGSWQTYEAEFKKVLVNLRVRGFTHVVFGDILLEEHKQWVERVCGEVGLKAWEPLWRESTTNLLREFLELGGHAQIVATKATLLDDSWLGRPLELSMLPSFERMGIDPCGENGEYHTLVTYFQAFRSPLRICECGRLQHDGYWMLDLILED